MTKITQKEVDKGVILNYLCPMAKRKKPKAKTIPRISAKPRPALYSEPYDWVNPSRPATDKELDELIAESENSPTLTLEESRKLSYELLAKWRKEGR